MRSDNMAWYRDLTLYNFVYIEFQLDYPIREGLPHLFLMRIRGYTAPRTNLIPELQQRYQPIENLMLWQRLVFLELQLKEIFV